MRSKSLYIPKPRRAEGDAKISAGEKTDLMSLVGQLAWIARESMPQISYGGQQPSAEVQRCHGG